jgi:two-component system chemotaxis sensor kinase CheA
MDAVRNSVRSMGGQVTLFSTRGAGSTVRIALPQTVSVTTVLTLWLGRERFGVPIEAVREIVRVPRDRIVPVGAGEAFVLRDRTLPLLRLSTLLDRPGEARPTAVKVLVASCNGEPVGIEVDGFAGRTDVLVRPMTGLLAGLPGLGGTALLGDGEVLMVLDLADLVG